MEVGTGSADDGGGTKNVLTERFFGVKRVEEVEAIEVIEFRGFGVDACGVQEGRCEVDEFDELVPNTATLDKRVVGRNDNGCVGDRLSPAGQSHVQAA